MPSDNRIVISAAGGGKTTRVVDQALSYEKGVTALITYTRNNVREIRLKVFNRTPAIPSRVEIISWYSFLLKELARPYRSVLHKRRIDGIHWIEGKSVNFVPATSTSAHYFLHGSRVYSDKLAKLVCECDRLSDGAVIRRLKQRFSHIIIDEIQDMAGYDLDLLELMLKSGISLTFVGDHRQATFATNHAPKNKQFGGSAIVKKFELWKKAGLASIGYETHTYRCNQAIADLGDSFFPNEPKTISKNNIITGHDGIFLVSAVDVGRYVDEFRPQILRFSAKTNCEPYAAMNFGESKGLTFDRILIYPHELAKKWLSSGQLRHVEKSATKMYVAATRARYSVAFVYDGKTCGIDAAEWRSS